MCEVCLEGFLVSLTINVCLVESLSCMLESLFLPLPNPPPLIPASASPVQPYCSYIDLPLRLPPSTGTYLAHSAVDGSPLVKPGPSKGIG